jgi:fructokinase
MKRFTTVGLGELLWDIFPQGRQLGGAPANFAYMTNLLGDEGIVASRVGRDELGEDAKGRLEHLGLGTSCIQLDPTYRTGIVQIEVDAKGQPTFQIAEPVAWDSFEWTPAWQALAQKADAVCFGSLAQRSPQSRQTIYAFLKTIRAETIRVFDVNLRQSFYSAQILADSAKQTDIIKLNSDELPTVAQLLGFPFHDEESAAQWLLHTFHIKLVCITRGARGSLLMSEYAKQEHPGIRVHVADTVGSGDAFTAALVYHYLRRDSLATMNEAANRMGSWVAGQTGATPAPDEARLELIRGAAQ